MAVGEPSTVAVACGGVALGASVGRLVGAGAAVAVSPAMATADGAGWVEGVEVVRRAG